MPTVLMFSLPGCAFCERLRAEQLIHLHRDAARIGVRVVELSMTDRRPIPGTEPPESPAAMARRLGVRLAPSVLFVSNEREIAPRLEGYGSPDFYGAYLDERTAQARQAIAEHVRR
ncbi:MAG: thioredoxin fold domain-containing protein [Burkholderiaceae bacterium]|nr:thioredoxin fold domain-containing protein [Burkholderiaceae bacterium]